MSADPYRGLHRDGLALKMLTYFETHPEEELTHADIRAKFDAKAQAASLALATLRRRKLLESVHIVRLRAKGRS